jgi:hypothetical protein
METDLIMKITHLHIMMQADHLPNRYNLYDNESIVTLTFALSVQRTIENNLLKQEIENAIID